jgi:hypothetical protein
MQTRRRSDSPLYKRHYQFFTGCTDPSTHAWQSYGARGCTMYKPWASFKQGFDRFEHWVNTNLGPMPSSNSIIRRIDSTKGVKPGNLEWSTRKISGNNRRTNHFVTIKGQTKSISQWCDERGLCYPTVWSRIVDRGWTPREALEL